MPDPQSRYVQTPDGVYHEFPASATDAQISEALSGNAAKSQSAPTLGQRALATANVLGAFIPGAPTVQRELGLLPAAGGAIGGTAGGVGGTVAGFGVGGLPGAVGGAAIGGGAGEAARQLASRWMGLPAPATAGQAAQQIGTQAAIQGGAELVGQGIGAGMQRAAPWLMQKAVKPGVALTEEYRTTGPKVARTLLNEGVNVTDGGVQKLQQLLSATNQDIADAVQAAKGSIAKTNVAANVLPTAAKLAQQVNPTAALEDVGQGVTEFMNHPVYSGPSVSVPEAQAMKVGTYQQIGKQYGQLSSAAVETQKALARGLKDEVAAAVPEISALNKRDSDLLAALDAVGRRVAVGGNRDPVGFAWVASASPKTFLAALIDRSPAVKSMIANGMWSSAEAATGVSANVIRGAVASIVSGSGGSQ